MASENIDLPKLDELSNPVGFNSRTNLSGKAAYGDKKEKVIPHYLRASTGSCHDLCKYGRKHEHDVKERIPISKRAVAKSFDGLNTQVACSNNPPTVKVRRSLGMKSHSADGFSANQEGISVASCNSRNQVKSGLGKCIDLSPAKFKTSPTLDSRSSIVSGTTKKMSPLASKETSSKTSSLKLKVKLPAKHVTSSTQSSITASIFKSTESLMVKKRTPKPISTLKPVSKSRLSEALREEGKHKEEKGLTTSRISLKKSLRYPVASLSPRSPLKRVASFHSRRNRTLKIASHLKNQHKLKKCASDEQSNVVEEKTLYVVKVESAKPDQSLLAKCYSSSSRSLSSQENQEESNLVINGDEDVICLSSNVTENVEKQVTVQKQKTITEKRTVKPRTDVSNPCKDKDCQPLDSRSSSRGKIVDIRSHTNSPRRFKFRRGRVMDETTSFKANARRRNFKRTSGDGSEVVETASGPHKVVLKHQDVQDKKEVQCLLNNVIEETASKLVESKKSKVRALVGAFETVISLQERKPDIGTVN